MKRILFSLPLLLLTLFFALPALAGNWGEDWGTLTWGAAIAAVPTMGWLGGGLLVGLLASLGLRRIRRVSTGLGLLLALAYAPVAEAQTVSVPNTFSNGSVADADEVNANFAGLVAAIQELQVEIQDLQVETLTLAVTLYPAVETFLTTDACPAGYDSVEEGYIKLGSTGLTTTASSRTLSSPGHGHSHSLQNAPYAGHLGVHHLPGSYVDTSVILDPPPLHIPHNPLVPLGAHNHTITGTVGSGSVSGDTAQAITGDLEHITLRLCVRTQ